jgi:hypothetical protein
VDYHSEIWVKFFSKQNPEQLDFWAAAGYLEKKSGSKYYTVLMDSGFYENVEWHFLNLEAPLRLSNFWAFRDTIAVEPFFFYASELEIKIVGDSLKVTHEQFPEPFSNFENTDLGSFINNTKLHKSKKDRVKKLKDKKEKNKK